MRNDAEESAFVVARAGRTFAASPKSTSQTSPRCVAMVFGFFAVVLLESLVGGDDQVCIRERSIAVVVNGSSLCAAKEFVHALCDASQFFWRERGQRSFDFGD